MRIFSHCIPQIFSDKDKKINSSPTRRSSSESPINPGRVADLQTFSSGTSLPVSGAKRGVLPGKNFIRKAKKKLRDLSAFMTQPIAKSIGIRAKVNPETHQVSNKPMPFLDYRDFQIDIRNLRLSKKITGYSRDDTFHSPEKINVKINLAAFKNNLAALEALLKMPGADPNKQDGQGYNPLLWASINRQVDAVKTLLKSPFIDVNVRDPDGFTPLMHACSNGDIQTVRALLSQPSKVQPHLAAHNGDTALIIAARKGHSDIIEVLLSHPKIEVNLCNSAGRSPLMIAALQGQLDCTQKLLQIPEIDINAEDQDGNTALMWASATGQLDVIDMLLEREDLDPSITNKSGFKAFEIAIRSGNFELSRVLSDALQKSKVLKRIESQLDSFSSEQITRLLEEGFISSERPQALQAMRLLTQYGNMKSLNHLQHWLLKMRRSGFSVLSNHEATLGSTMAYLTAKERGNPAPGGNYHPFKQDGVFRLPIMQMAKGAILLDHNMFHQLQTNPQLADYIKANDFLVLYADGWNEGLNPFNQYSLDKLGQGARKALDIAKDIATRDSITEEQALHQAISQPTREYTRSLGLEDRFFVLKNEPRIEKTEMPTPQEIAQNLQPARISRAQFSQMLDGFSDPEYRSAVLELLQKNSEIFSPKRLSEFYMRKQKTIEAFAKERHIPKQSIYYWIPRSNKSYGIVTMQYQMVNNIPLDRIVTDIQQQVPSKKSMVVILDDVAGSGDSLRGAYHDLKYLYKGPIVISPVISTKIADEKMRKVCGRDLYLPGKVIEPYTETLDFANLSAERRKVFELLMGSLGYNNNGLCVAFPYMAPDNNNEFFAKKIAPYFTLNGSGVKTY